VSSNTIFSYDIVIAEQSAAVQVSDTTMSIAASNAGKKIIKRIKGRTKENSRSYGKTVGKRNR
jgi:hypothetical protein